MSERVVWEGWCSIVLPEGWSWTEEDDVITIVQDAGAGALQVSFARRSRQGPVQPDEALEVMSSWTSSHGWQDILVRRIRLAEEPAAEVEYISAEGTERTYWKVWSLVESERAALITYVCDAAEAHLEKPERDAMVGSFRWLPH